MFKRDVVYRGGVAKLSRPMGKRPSDLNDIVDASAIIQTTHKDHVPTVSHLAASQVAASLEDVKVKRRDKSN